MNVSEQCRIAASKGNHSIGMIRRNITYKEPNNYIFFKIKTGNITRGHDFIVVKGQSRLDFRK